MGSYNYLVIPAFKLKIMTKLDNSNLDLQGYEDFFGALKDQISFGSIEEVTINQLTLENLTQLFLCYKSSSRICELIYLEEILCYYLQTKGVHFYFLHESQEEELAKINDFISFTGWDD